MYKKSWNYGAVHTLRDRPNAQIPAYLESFIFKKEPFTISWVSQRLKDDSNKS